MLTIERRLWADGFSRVAGIDEAGRGPLAGPVVAAAVVFDRNFAESEEDGALAGLTDSKKISEGRREAFCSLLYDSPAVDIGVGTARVDEIDRLNIMNATHVAMARAVEQLASAPDYALVDGYGISGLRCRSAGVIKGDGKSLSIAAASIVAKVFRDAHMRRLDEEFPGYAFGKHKGYGSRRHMQALFEHGPSPVHRRSFRPVREAAEIQRLLAAGEGGRNGRLL